MNWTVHIHPLARLEMLEATEWYAGQGGALGGNFMKGLDAVLFRIRENPLQYQVAYGQLRRAGLHRFPYSLIYTVEEREVIVLGCVHGRRDPRRWQNRT
jgi:hypothetical protein